MNQTPDTTPTPPPTLQPEQSDLFVQNYDPNEPAPAPPLPPVLASYAQEQEDARRQAEREAHQERVALKRAVLEAQATIMALDETQPDLMENTEARPITFTTDDLYHMVGEGTSATLATPAPRHRPEGQISAYYNKDEPYQSARKRYLDEWLTTEAAGQGLTLRELSEELGYNPNHLYLYTRAPASPPPALVTVIGIALAVFSHQPPRVRDTNVTKITVQYADATLYDTMVSQGLRRYADTDTIAKHEKRMRKLSVDRRTRDD